MRGLLRIPDFVVRVEMMASSESRPKVILCKYGGTYGRSESS
jgi:hypothetical protein